MLVTVRVSFLPVNEDKVVIRNLPQDFDPGDFDCEDEDYNDYIADGTAWRDEITGVTRTYIALYDDRFSGYIAVLSDAIQLNRKERPSDVGYPSTPALKIGRLATDKKMRGTGLGAYLIDFAVGIANDIALSAGCRYLTLDALPHREDYYKKLGFVANKEERRRFRILRNKDPVNISMRFDLFDKG